MPADIDRVKKLHDLMFPDGYSVLYPETEVELGYPTAKRLTQELEQAVLEAELRGFDVAFDSHDYDRLRKHKATLQTKLNQVKDRADG